jgi:hypothetical protein
MSGSVQSNHALVVERPHYIPPAEQEGVGDEPEWAQVDEAAAFVDESRSCA